MSKSEAQRATSPQNDSRIGALRQRLREAIWYLIVGGSAFVVDFVIFNGLRQIGWTFMAANSVSVSVSTGFAFFGHFRATFKHVKRVRVQRALFRFVGLNFFSILATFSMLYMANTSQLADGIVLENLFKLAIILGVTVLKYLVMRRFIFVV